MDKNIGIFTTDASLNIRTWDPWLAKITGVPSEKARGKNLLFLFPDLEERGIKVLFLKCLHEGTTEILSPAFHHYLFPCSTEKPSKFFQFMQQAVHISPLKSGGEIIGLIVTVEDVTERREQEKYLLEKLKSKSEEERLIATKSLKEIDEAQEEAILAGLRDKSWRVRKEAVQAILKRERNEVFKEILESLQKDYQDIDLLNSALQVMELTSVDVVDSLISFLKHGEKDLRIYAALTLGNKRDPRGIPPLLEALNDPDKNVRFHAIEALGKLKAQEAVKPLLEILKTGDFFLAFPALDSLVQIGNPEVVPNLIDFLEDQLLRERVVEALGKLGDDQMVEPLVNLLNRSDEAAIPVCKALYNLFQNYEKTLGEGEFIARLTKEKINYQGIQNILGSLGSAESEDLRFLLLVLGWTESKAAHQTLIRFLGVEDVQNQALEAVVRHGKGIVETLIQGLSSDDLEVRRAAVIALGRIGAREAVPFLCKKLKEEPELVPFIAGALAKIGDRNAFKPLMDLLNFPDASTRMAIIGALNSLGHPEMPEVLKEKLKDPNPVVRESAVRIAGYFGYPSLSDILLEECGDPDERVRKQAIESLPYLDDPRAIPILQHHLENDSPMIRASCAKALGNMDFKEAFYLLQKALKDPDPWVRYFSARSLGNFPIPEAVDSLVSALEEDHASLVKVACLASLGKIGGSRVVALISPYVTSSNLDIAQAAIFALGEISHPDSLPILLRMARAREKERKVAALQALGNKGTSEVIGELQFQAASESNPEVFNIALESLLKISTPEAWSVLVSLATVPRLKEPVLNILKKAGERVISVLEDSLKNPLSRVRLVAVEALQGIKSEDTSRLLVKALEDGVPEVRLKAALTLKRLKSRLGERELLRIAKTDPDPRVRKALEAS